MVFKTYNRIWQEQMHFAELDLSQDQQITVVTDGINNLPLCYVRRELLTYHSIVQSSSVLCLAGQSL